MSVPVYDTANAAGILAAKLLDLPAGAALQPGVRIADENWPSENRRQSYRRHKYCDDPRRQNRVNTMQ